MGVFSPPKTPELAGAFPRIVGEGEGLQAVKGEVGGQLRQAVVLQVNVFQRGHPQEGTVRELGSEEDVSEHPSPWCSATPSSKVPTGAGSFPRRQRWLLEAF